MGDRIEGRLRGAGMLVVGALAVALAFTTGCGGGDGDDGKASAAATVVQKPRPEFAYARARFREMCAGCHTLADASARGRRFNLDHDPGLEEPLVRSIILGGGPGMPAFGDTLSRREYEELVAYVLEVVRREEGEDDWRWQILLRQEGARIPKDAPSEVRRRRLIGAADR